MIKGNQSIYDRFATRMSLLFWGKIRKNGFNKSKTYPIYWLFQLQKVPDDCALPKANKNAMQK
jgi:hypothetical protein